MHFHFHVHPGIVHGEMKESEAQQIESLLTMFKCMSSRCTNERELQDRVSRILASYGVEHIREHPFKNDDGRYGGTSRYDFYLSDTKTVIETKTRCGRSALLQQIKRYADNEDVTQIMVLSRHPIVLPDTLSGKAVHNVEIWKNFA